MGIFGLDKITRFELDEAADFLVHELPFVNSVDLVIQLGSGQTAEGLLDDEWNRLSMRDLPHLPREESMAHHRMEILWGKTGELRLLVYAGRYHFYEGYGRSPVLLPVWAAARCGARNFLFCNAAGGIRDDLVPGTFMVIRDHLNCLGVSPLAGHQHLLTSSYVDMTRTYSTELNESLLRAAATEHETVLEGVYMANVGPQFETPAEVRAARQAGADAVGMSTVLEATAARAWGARVMGLSMIVNRAAGLGDGQLSHVQTQGVGHANSQRLLALLRRWLADEAPKVL